VRRALVAVLLLAGCGGSSSQAPAIRDHLAPPDERPVVVEKIGGTDLSAQEIADQAVQAPLADGTMRPEAAPLAEEVFEKPIARYRTYSARQAAAMQTQVAALRRALRAGDRAAARRAWAGAYRRYLLIGAAYGALGDLDASIVDGRMRIERGLWEGERLSALEPTAARMAADVRTLRRTVPKIEITPRDYAIRAHEILEDAQRDMLSGVASPWSGAGVLATAASLNATYAVVGTLHSILAQRGTLAPVETGLLRLREELDAIRKAHGGEWPALDELSQRERQRLTGRLGAALEILADVPDALATQLPPTVPEIKP
jgi:high-affinity iron transporter